MIIMGIDPGFARVGWAVISEKNSVIAPLDFGCIETEKTEKTEVRLAQIYDSILKHIKKHQPGALAIEDLFFATNAKTVIGVGQSRGVILLAAAKQKIPVVSYSPLSIKRTVTGDGKADKKQVEHMIMLTLKLKQTPKPDDTIDALAIAMTHAYSYKINSI